MRSPRAANAWRPLARLLWARTVSRRRALNSAGCENHLCAVPVAAVCPIGLNHQGIRRALRLEARMHGIKQLLQAIQTRQSLIVAWANAPVVAVCRSRAILRDETWLPRYGAISLTVTPPIMPTGTDWAAALMLRGAAHNKILRHCGNSDAVLP